MIATDIAYTETTRINNKLETWTTLWTLYCFRGVVRLISFQAKTDL